MGYAIPAGTSVGVNPLFTHHMPEIWPEPEKFDPTRFTDEAQRAAIASPGCRSAAARICAFGLHFAYMQAKCFARHFLQNLSVSWSRLHAGLADVADPQAPDGLRRDAETGR